MQVLDLNLASRPFRNNTLLWVGCGLAVLLLGWFSFWNVQSFMSHAESLADLRHRVSKIDSQMAELDIRDRRAAAAIEKYDLKALATQAAKANDVIEWKAFSWTRLFNLLEQLQPYKVRMTSIRPVFYGTERRRSAAEGAPPEGAIPVRVQGVAADLQTFLELERSLLLDPHFDQVEPEGNTQLKSKETKFDLKFLYFPERIPDSSPPDLEPVVPLGTPKEFARAEAEARAAAEAAEQQADGDPAADSAGEEEVEDDPEAPADGGGDDAPEDDGGSTERTRPEAAGDDGVAAGVGRS